MYLVYNSDVLPQVDFTLTSDNRAFLYGDGLFETIRYEAGKIWFWADHYDRLTRGMAALQLQPPPGFDLRGLHELALQLVEVNGFTNQPTRVKLQVWRKPGGLYTPTNLEADFLITVRPGQPFTISLKQQISVYESVRLSASPFSAFKTINALPYVLAGLYRQERGLDDVLLLSTEGHLAECLASNLFWFRDGQLFTPALQTGCVDGVARRQLLRAFSDAHEGLFFPSALDEAEVVFAANVAGIQFFNGQFSTAQMTQMQQIFTN